MLLFKSGGSNVLSERLEAGERESALGDLVLFSSIATCVSASGGNVDCIRCSFSLAVTLGTTSAALAKDLSVSSDISSSCFF